MRSGIMMSVWMVVAILWAIPTNAQRKLFRAKQVDAVGFIIPPKAKLACEGIFNRKTQLSFSPGSRFRFQYVIIQGLQAPDYPEASRHISNAVYLFDRHPQTELLRRNHCGMRARETTTHPAAAVYFSEEGNCIAIELDYDWLVVNPVVGNFENMSLALLAKLFELEARFTWPRSICQEILQKVFELAPTPGVAALSAFGYVRRSRHSVILLHPKITLKCDTLSKIPNPLSDGGVLYKWDSVKLISFYRDATGHVRQLPNDSLDRTIFPPSKIATLTNIYDGTLLTVNYYIIAGSADLELSATITSSRFLALFQPVTRSANASESLGDSDANNCCASPYDCASQIVLSEDIATIFSPQHQCSQMPVYENVAVVGERNTISAFYTIYVNGAAALVKAGTTTQQLLQQGKITPATTIRRAHNRKLVDIVTNGKSICLLPTDHLIIK